LFVYDDVMFNCWLKKCGVGLDHTITSKYSPRSSVQHLSLHVHAN